MLLERIDTGLLLPLAAAEEKQNAFLSLRSGWMSKDEQLVAECVGRNDTFMYFTQTFNQSTVM